MLELAQRLRFDLADAFAGDRELLADLFRVCGRCSLYAACRARSTPTVAATTGTRPRPAARSTRIEADPGRPGPGAARHRADRRLFARGPGTLGAHAFGTLQKRLPQGAQAAPASPPSRPPTGSLQGGLPGAAQRPLRRARPEHSEGSAFVAAAFGGVPGGHPLPSSRSVSSPTTTPSATTAVSLQIPADRHRPASLRQGARPGARISGWRTWRCLPRSPTLWPTTRADGMPHRKQPSSMAA